MVELNILALTEEYKCTVYTTIKLPENYTMNMVVKEIKRRRFCAFMLLDTMKKLVYV